MSAPAATPNGSLPAASAPLQPPLPARFAWQMFYTARTAVQRRFNRYNDVEIEAASLYHETVEWFIYEVQMERQAWEARNEDMNLDPVVLKNACFWISLPVAMAFYLSYLLQMGFTVHHATAARFVLVTRSSAVANVIRLASDPHIKAPSIDDAIIHTSQTSMEDAASDGMGVNGVAQEEIMPVPEYGTHYCRIECIVVHRALHVDGYGNRFARPYVLMVRERFGKIYAKDATGEIYAKSWKFVSGSVTSGEFFADAAARELAEETGIKAEFVGVVAVCNRLQTRFLRDEIMLCCLMVTPVVSTLPSITKSEEILDVAWIPIECVHVTLSNNVATYSQLANGWLHSAVPKIQQLNNASGGGEDAAAASSSPSNSGGALMEMRIVDQKTQKEVRNYLFV